METKTGKAYVANLGDSRSMHGLMNPEEKDFRITELSKDHKPGNPAETKRIEDAGYAALEMSPGQVRIFNP